MSYGSDHGRPIPPPVAVSGVRPIRRQVRCDETIVFVEFNKSGSTAAAVRRAHELGIRSRVLVKSREAYSGSKHYSYLGALLDEAIECDTDDSGAIALAAADGSRGVSAIVAGGDHHAQVAARAAVKAGARGLGQRAAGCANDKLATYVSVRAAGLSTPDFTVIHPNAPILPSAAALLECPAVIKPVDGAGNDQVLMTRAIAQGLAHIRAIRARARNHRGQLLRRAALITSFVDGPEYSIECVVCDGRTSVVGIIEKQTTGEPYFLEIQHDFPAMIASDRGQQLGNFAVAVATTLGVEYGVLHIEVRVDARTSRPVLMECNARPGGDHIPDLLELATGRSLIDAWILSLAGRQPCSEWIASRYARVRFGPSSSDVDAKFPWREVRSGSDDGESPPRRFWSVQVEVS